MTRNTFLQFAQRDVIELIEAMLQELQNIRRESIDKSTRKRHFEAGLNSYYDTDASGGMRVLNPEYYQLSFEPALYRSEIDDRLKQIDLQDVDDICSIYSHWCSAEEQNAYLDVYAARELILLVMMNPSVQPLGFINFYPQSLLKGSSDHEFEFGAALCQSEFNILCSHSTHDLGYVDSHVESRDISASDEHHMNITWIMSEWAFCLGELGKTKAQEELYNVYKEEMKRLFPHSARYSDSIVWFHQIRCRFRNLTPDSSDDDIDVIIKQLSSLASGDERSRGYEAKATGTRDYLERVLERRKGYHS